MKTYYKAITAGIIFCLGIGMLFFEQTHSIGPFLIGFGLVVCMMSIKGDD